MTSSQLSSGDDDVRRSLDVLDQVLSEFDDIEPGFVDSDSRGSESPGRDHGGPDAGPPPIDRSLKPKCSPPTLPQKTKRKPDQSPPGDQNGQIPEFSPDSIRTQRSEGSKRSEVSSHEYQEINSDLCSSAIRTPGGKQRHRNSKEFPAAGGQVPRAGSHETGLDMPLRKSRSGDVMIGGRKGARRHAHQRRGRSTDRLLGPSHSLGPIPPFFDPRVHPDSVTIDPRLMDPRSVDPRLMDPRFLDPRLFNQLQNPRHMDQRLLIDPRLDPQLPMFMDNPHHLPLDVQAGQFSHIEDPMQFPHLLHPSGRIPPGSYSLPPPNAMDFHPHTIPPYEYPLMQDHLMGDPMLDYPFHPLDPRIQGFPGDFDPSFKTLDPSLIGPSMHPQDYPIDLPFNYPANLPHAIPPTKFAPRERLSLDGEGRVLPPHPNDLRFMGEHGWLPPTPEEARKTIQKLVRNPNHLPSREEVKSGRERFANDPKMSKVKSHKKSTGSSDSSGRSSPLEGGPRSRKGSQSNIAGAQRGSRGSPRGRSHSVEPEMKSEANPGVFILGDAVRKDGQPMREFGGKETVSLPRFVSGGKDSGFDEIPVAEDSTSSASPNGRGGGTPVGVGGGFVVAGVFSDSSKMYIPAPPSPTPDYDNELGDSDGDDIPQEPFYVSKDHEKAEANRGSLSEDSLQCDSVTGESKGESQGESSGNSRNSLQALMAEFHSGLPPPAGREEGRFSDDSLEDESTTSNISPSRPSINSDSRLESTESLVSMEGSTTSFDYLSQVSPPGAKTKSNSSSPTKGKNKLQKLLKRDIKSSKSNENLGSSCKSNENRDSSCKSNENRDSLCKSKENLGSSCKSKENRNSMSILNENRDLTNNSRGNRDSKCKSINSTCRFDENRDITCKSNENILPQKTRVEAIPEIETQRQSHTSNSEAKTSANDNTESKKDVPKFDTIRNLMKVGLIEGLDETPPDFVPPPPTHKSWRRSSTSEERADSGIGSMASTNNRADESGGSDDVSELQSATPPKHGLENGIVQRRMSSPPPLPPPRDSSISTCSSGSTELSNAQQSLVRNQSWLFRDKKPGDLEQLDPNQNSSKKSSGDKKHKKDKREKITHVDGDNRKVKSDDAASQYATPQDQHRNELNKNIFHENRKNLIGKRVCENPSVIYGDHDQESLSSHGSRSGRFFSRLTESMKSSSRSNSPLHGKNSNHRQNSNQQKRKNQNGMKYHADFIRAPSHCKYEAPQPPPLGYHPQDYRNAADSPHVLSRDGSGRFRSIEDLKEVSGHGGKSLELRRVEADLQKKGKKNSTLPPNLTPADMLEQERELKRTISAAQGNKNKDEEGTKFKFNLFKGFWRRNKYSFEKF